MLSVSGGCVLPVMYAARAHETAIALAQMSLLEPSALGDVPRTRKPDQAAAVRCRARARTGRPAVPHRAAQR